MFTRKYYYLGVFLLGSLVVLATSFGIAQDLEVAQDANGAPYIPGELIVTFKQERVNLEKSRGMQTLSQMEDKQDFTTAEVLPKENIALVTVDKDKSLDSEIARLEMDPNVESVQPNYVYDLLMEVPNDPEFPLQYTLRNVGQYIVGNGSQGPS